MAQRGFTLVELLVAISVLAVMALASWRGVDAMALAQNLARGHADQVSIVQTALAQWQSDLDQAQESGLAPAIDHDGQVLRLTRVQSGDGPARLQVVAYARRDTEQGARWMRWRSEPAASRAALQAAWDQAGRWGRGAMPSAERAQVELAEIEDLQVLLYRNGAWAAPLPRPVNAQPNPNSPIPDGVRLLLTLTSTHPLSGAITQDWVRPTLGGGKS